MKNDLVVKIPVLSGFGTAVEYVVLKVK